MDDNAVVIFPTDYSETSIKALDWARKMCSQLDAELHCITAVEAPVVYTPMYAPSAVPSINELLQQAEEGMADFAKQELTGFDKTPQTKVMQGRPVDEIVRYAKEQNAAVIVMATHGRSGLSHLLIGSTAEGVVRHAECPVLTVRDA